MTMERKNDGMQTSRPMPGWHRSASEGSCYLFGPESLARGLLGCGLRKVAAVGAGFLSAFGFFASRLPLLRPLANGVLPFWMCFLGPATCNQSGGRSHCQTTAY